MQTPILSEKVHNVMSQQNTITELRKASGSLEKLRRKKKKKKKHKLQKCHFHQPWNIHILQLSDTHIPGSYLV